MKRSDLKNAEQIKTWFNRERQRLSGNGVWFQGCEPNTQNPDLFSKASIKVLLVRLSSYGDVSAGITHQYLYQMASSVDGCYVDMAFLPPEQDEAIMREAGIPLLVGTTSKEPALNFDVIAISNSVLQELINLPALLEYSAIPLTRESRARENAPLVILGGSNSCTHSILHGEVGKKGESGLVDGVLMGDGEQVFARTLALIRDNKSLERVSLLKLIRDYITGFYEPASYCQVFENNKLVRIEHDERAPFPVKSSKTACDDKSECFTCGPVMYENSGVSHVIVSAGCPSFCSFCKESWEQKPYRENSYERVFDSAMKLKACMGLNEVSLMTFNANTCSDVAKLVNELGSRFDRVAIKSQRFDAVVHAPELLDLQFDAGKRTYTLAMEGISERLRTILEKNLDESSILKGIDLLMQRNMRQMKVFLILTGYETEEDITEFKLFLDKIGKATQTGRNKPRITFSFATLFRSPQTPMEYAPKRASARQMKTMLDLLCKSIKSAGYDARISSGPEEALFSECVAYSDRRYTKVLVETSINNGARYRGEITAKALDAWLSSMKKFNLPMISEEPRTIDTLFPWDDVDTGINKAFLWQIWNNVNSGKEIKACLAKPWGTASCAGCNACKTADYRDKLHKMGPGLASIKTIGVKNKKKVTKWFYFEIPEKWAFCNKEFIKTAFARRLMLDSKEMAERFQKVELVEPEIFSYGKVLAKVTLAGNASYCNKINEDDISNIKEISPASKEEETAFPVTLELSSITDVFSFSRDVDALLTRYSLKNLKQRANGWLNWTINSGQAKKAGITKLSLNEKEGYLHISLIKWPEQFLLNKLSNNRYFKIVSIGRY